MQADGRTAYDLDLHVKVWQFLCHQGSFLLFVAVLLSLMEEDGAHGFFQESALSVKHAVMRDGGALAGGKMAQEDAPESRQLPFHKHGVVSESEQTPPPCVLTSSLFGWRRKSKCLLRACLGKQRRASSGIL
jgi:hypothetical protein